MACDPDGRGPNPTCLATCSNATLPSNPPVLSGGGASSAPPCPAFGAVAAAVAGLPAAAPCASSFALHPVILKSPAHKKSTTFLLNFHAAGDRSTKSRLTLPNVAVEPTQCASAAGGPAAAASRL